MNREELQPLSINILKCMEHKGIIQAQLARKMGYSRAGVNKFFMKGWNPTMETLVKICIALDLKLTLKLTEV